jgi:precorrin-6Y C5,15-methyltransferase (decarboxylating)
VFIGGGLSDPGVLDAAWSALKPGGRLVANTVSIDSEARLIEGFQRHGGELVRLQASKAHRIGTVFAWRSATPVTQWRVRKP